MAKFVSKENTFNIFLFAIGNLLGSAPMQKKSMGESMLSTPTRKKFYDIVAGKFSDFTFHKIISMGISNCNHPIENIPYDILAGKLSDFTFYKNISMGISNCNHPIENIPSKYSGDIARSSDSSKFKSLRYTQ